MKAVILCGGLGTRLREETEYRPKPLVDIGGRPIIWHIMKIYAHFGVKDFVLCLGYRGHMIRQFFLEYETMINDFTIDLGSRSKISFHSSHHEDRQEEARRLEYQHVPEHDGNDGIQWHGQWYNA